MSEQEVPSQKEPLLNPIVLFDAHLREVEELYIPFFEERIKIEETYIANLTTLQSKCRSSIEKSPKKNLLRQAWHEMPQSVEREVQCRFTFVSTLGKDALRPLVDLKNAQRRLRDRAKIDLKEAAQLHIDFCEHTLPRLKRSYFKKMQDIEEHNPSPISSPSNRSPTSPSSLSSLALQGKKALKGLLQEGATKQGAIAFADQRDADEADREYRKGVREAESLRSKRAVVIQGVYLDLRDLILEKTTAIESSMKNYMECLRTMSTAIAQLAFDHSSAIQKCSLDKDRDQIRSTNQISTAIKQNLPRTLYHNYRFGECNDIAFGISLVDYAAERGLAGDPRSHTDQASMAMVPLVVRKCIAEIEIRGLQAEWLYQVSGRLSVVHQLRARIEKNELSFEFNPYDDIHCVVSLLKSYLRELPEPVFRFPLQERIQHTEDRDEQIQACFPVLRHKIKQLPLVHQATLRTFIEHLSRVAAQSRLNQMSAKNLAVVLGNCLFGQEDMPMRQEVLSPSLRKDTVLEDMIGFSGLLYGDKTPWPSPASGRTRERNLTESPLSSPRFSRAESESAIENEPAGPVLHPVANPGPVNFEVNYSNVPLIRLPIAPSQRHASTDTITRIKDGIGSTPDVIVKKDNLDLHVASNFTVMECEGPLVESPKPKEQFGARAERPWESGNSKEYEFLSLKEVFNPMELCLTRHDYLRLSHFRNENFLVLSFMDKATIFNFATKGVREFKWSLTAIGDLTQRSYCILSPDGGTIVRMTATVNGTVEVFDLKTKQRQSILPQQYRVDGKDISKVHWKDSATLYLPIRASGQIVRWSVRDINPLTAFQVLQVMGPIAQHEHLEIYVTSDEKWWVALGTTTSANGSQIESGLLEVHDVQNEESRLVPGRVCCIVETEVYDVMTPLLVKADCVQKGKLSLQVQSLGAPQSGDQQFEPVNVAIDITEPSDTPIQVFSLHPLPIVAVITAECAIYFFELHTGTLLYSKETHLSERLPVLDQWQEGKGFHLLDRGGISTWVTINERDLIGWVRHVLQNDTLASAIAIRTGLPGAEDVILDDMYRNHAHLSRASTIKGPPLS